MCSARLYVLSIVAGDRICGDSEQLLYSLDLEVLKGQVEKIKKGERRVGNWEDESPSGDCELETRFVMSTGYSNVRLKIYEEPLLRDESVDKSKISVGQEIHLEVNQILDTLRPPCAECEHYMTDYCDQTGCYELNSVVEVWPFFKYVKKAPLENNPLCGPSVNLQRSFYQLDRPVEVKVEKTPRHGDLCEECSKRLQRRIDLLNVELERKVERTLKELSEKELFPDVMGLDWGDGEAWTKEAELEESLELKEERDRTVLLTERVTQAAFSAFGKTLSSVKVRDCIFGNPFMVVELKFDENYDYTPTKKRVREWMISLKDNVFDFFPDDVKTLSFWNESFEDFNSGSVSFTIGKKD